MHHLFLCGNTVLLSFSSAEPVYSAWIQVSYYYLTNISRDSVGVSLWFTVIGGAAAGISGILLGGGLIKLYSILTTYEKVFKCYYTTMFILLIPVLYYACTLKATSKDVWSIRKVLKFFFTPGKVYSLYKIRNQRKFSSTNTELNFVDKLSGMSPDLSEKYLIYYLKSPDYFVRTEALHRMEIFKLGKKSKITLYNHIKTRTDYNLPVASCILAKNNFTKALPLFRKRLTDTDLVIVCSSMLALAIMNDKQSYNKIINIFNDAEDYWRLYYGARAIAFMKDTNAISCLLKKLTYAPKTILKHYYECRSDSKRKNKFINYLIEALERDTPEMAELKIFKDYFSTTERSIIHKKLMAVIFIKLFCKNEPGVNDIIE